jgi:hypothetical protein
MYAMSADMMDAINNKAPVALLADIGHPLGTVYVWTGMGILPYNGKEYVGLGILAGIEPIQQTTEISIQEVGLTLNTLQDNPALFQDFISYSVKGYEANVYMAAFNNNLSVVRDPVNIMRIRLDHQTITMADDGKLTIVLTGQSGFYKLQRSIDISYTAEEFKEQFSDETGLDMISQMATKETTWTQS